MLVGIGSLLAIIGLWCFAKTWSGKLIALVGVCVMAWIAWLVGDEYILSFTTAACIPLILYVFEKKNNVVLCMMLSIAGLMVVYANFCRIHTGTLLALVIGLRLLLYKEKIRTKLFLGAFFIVGFFFANHSISSLFSQRNEYFKQCGYVATSTQHQHTFWHNLYPGFGFIENDKNLYFSDNCSAQKVASIDPDAVYLSPEYNAVLKREVASLVLHAPHFVMRVLFAKLGVLFYYLLLCLLPALWAIFFFYMPVRMQLCYAVAMVWGAAPGFLTIPNALYILGFLTTAWLYGLHAIIYTLNKQSCTTSLKRIKDFFVQLFHTVRHME